jgi:hypothetical protein
MKRVTLRLYRGMSVKGPEVVTNLDPGDDDVLRGWFDKRVQAVMGTLQLDLSNGWCLHVIDVRGGPIYAKVRVKRNGETAVTR